MKQRVDREYIELSEQIDLYDHPHRLRQSQAGIGASDQISRYDRA